jgi:hypothetical protein
VLHPLILHLHLKNVGRCSPNRWTMATSCIRIVPSRRILLRPLLQAYSSRIVDVIPSYLRHVTWTRARTPFRKAYTKTTQHDGLPFFLHRMFRLSYRAHWPRLRLGCSNPR